MGRRQQTTPPRDQAVVAVISTQTSLAARVRGAVRAADEVITVAPDRITELPSEARLIVLGDLGGSPPGGVVAELSRRYQAAGLRLPPVVTVGVRQPVEEAFYQATATLGDRELHTIIASALALKQPPEIALDNRTHRLNRIYEYGRRFAEQRDLVAAAKMAANAALDLVSATRAHVWFVDETEGALWSGGDGDEAHPALGAAHGIAGFAVRVGQLIAVPRAGDDPRYNPIVDNPHGAKDDRLAAVPIANAGGEVHAVLVATREKSLAPFGDDDLFDLRELAQTWAPFLHQLSKELQVKHVIQQAYANPNGDRIFRDEALAYQQLRTASGDVIRVHPGWVQSVVWLIVGAFVLGVVFTSIARVHRYAQGPAVIRMAGRSEITATQAGTVAAMRVKTGQSVAAGQLLVKLSDTEQTAAFSTAQAEFERNLILYLQAPNDKGIRQALSSLVKQRDAAKAALDARQIYAPHAGVIREILVGEGQRIEPGTVVASLAAAHGAGGARIYAFIPGTERPRLQVGQQMRLTIAGFRNTHVVIDVDRVSTEILGGEEAVRRYLGGRFTDSLTLTGPVVVVEGSLNKTSFQADGDTFEMPDGMAALAEVRLKSEPMIVALVAGES